MSMHLMKSCELAQKWNAERQQQHNSPLQHVQETGDPLSAEQTVEGAIITRIILSNDFIPYLQEIYENEKLSIKLKQKALTQPIVFFIDLEATL